MNQRQRRRSPAPRYGMKSSKKQSDFVHLLLFYILPFVVFNGLLFFFMTTKPKVSISVAAPKDYTSTTAEIEVSSILPIKSMVVTQESVEIQLEKTSRGHYTAAITANGVLEVSVVGFNGMTAAAYEPIDVLDDTPPSINEDFVIEDGILTFTIEDSQSGVDFTTIRATASDGTSVSPLSVDKNTNKVSFEMDSNGLTIHASDMCGNAVQAGFNTDTHEVVQTEEGGAEQQTPPAEGEASGESQAETSGGSETETSAPAERGEITISTTN